MPVVARGLVVLHAVFLIDDFRRGPTRERIVPATGVFGDRDENAAHVGVKAVALGESRGVLALERVGEIQTLGEQLKVIHQSRHIRPAFDVGHTQRGPAFQNVRPVRAGRHDFLKTNGRWVEHQ